MARRRRRRRRARPSAKQRLAALEQYHRRVADALIEQIERGTAPWTEAWKPGQGGLPCNIKTGKAYRGGNTVWLASTARRRHYSDERWGTYKQVRELGGHVRRGERGCQILFWQFETRKLARDASGKPVVDKAGRPEYETKPLSSPRVYRYTVFNAEQCGGLPPRTGHAASHAWNRHEAAEQVLRRSGAVIEHTGEERAYFDLRRDRVVLPFKQQFPDGPSYYQAALHELGHWTGHPSRLNRQTLLKGIEHGYGSQAYAREELRAEISSMMTGDRLDIGHDPSRHAAYVGSWIQSLREDPKEIYRASRDAQLMSDWLIERARQRTPEGERAVGSVAQAARPAEARRGPGASIRRARRSGSAALRGGPGGRVPGRGGPRGGLGKGRRVNTRAGALRRRGRGQDPGRQAGSGAAQDRRRAPSLAGQWRPRRSPRRHARLRPAATQHARTEP